MINTIDVRASGNQILVLERSALDRWGRGDPVASWNCLRRMSPDFDPVTARRIDGHQVMVTCYRPWVGKIRERPLWMLNPHVVVDGNLALLTYNLVNYIRDAECVEPVGSRWMQEHWSIRLRRAAGVAVLAMAVISGCADRRDVPGADASVALVPMDTLVSTASELVGGIYDLTVSPDGDVYVADYSYKHVLVVGSDGAVRRRIGRQGRGPGEFDMPFAVFAGTDSVRVLDAARNEVQVFDGAGVLARGYRLDVPGVGGGRVFRDDGSLAATIDGFEQAMVLVLDASGRRVGRFGEPIVPPVTSYDFTALKSAIQDGRVPDAFRNRATPAWAADHSLYLVFLAEPQVRRYDPAGRLIWTRTLDEPVLHTAREAFVRKNTQEQNSARIHPLQYVTDAEVVAGDLWLLLNTADDDEGLLLILNAHDGAVRRRVTFPGLPNTGFFAVDSSRGRMYMAPRGEASILIFDIPRS